MPDKPADPPADAPATPPADATTGAAEPTPTTNNTAPVVVASTPTAPAPAAAGHGGGDEGLKAGTVAPQFMLPVVNDFKDGKKWGPAKWTGTPAPTDAKKLVIMSFFATYCEPCKKEMPELARLYDKYKGDGLGIMLVSIDKGDEQKQMIIDLAKKSGVSFPVIHDRFQVVARRYSAERLPYMLMLDSGGTIKTVHVGYTEELKAGLENEVRAHLGMPPLPSTPAEADAVDPKKPAAPKKGKAG